jgi:type IV pilus assembly protein PilE
VKKNGGFTLIELMVVVIVIAVLAAIALPSYLNQTRKSRRSAVESAMQQIALLQERFRADCTTYATSFSYTCPTGSTPPVFPTLASLYSSTTYYNVTLPTVAGGTPGTAYTIKAAATSTGKQSSDTASGTPCPNLYYTYGQDTNVDAACTGVTTAAGVLTKCPAACWAQ